MSKALIGNVRAEIASAKHVLHERPLLQSSTELYLASPAISIENQISIVGFNNQLFDRSKPAYSWIDN